MALHAERPPLYESLADAVLIDSSRDEVRKAVLRCARSRAPAGTKLCGRSPRRAATRCTSGEGLSAAASGPSPGGRFVITDEPSAPLYGRCGPAAELRIPPGEEHKTLATVERLLRDLAGAGMDHDDHVVALGGGVVGDVGGLLRRRLPARRAGRPGADHARRPGRLGVRRQDRRRPARRARTTPAPTTSRP